MPNPFRYPSALDQVPSLNYAQQAPDEDLLYRLNAFSQGMGGGLANQVDAYAALAQHPIEEIRNMAQGVYQIARHPFEAGKALYDYGRQSLQSEAGAGQLMGEFVNPRSLFNLGAFHGKPVMSEMTAYHGSPHKFDKFDMSKIGTGEGAQAYGHGLYFAEDPNVAKSYAAQGVSNQHIARMKAGGTQNPDTALKYAAENFQQNGYSLEEAMAGVKQAYPDANQADLDYQVKAAYGESDKGNFYNVDIPDEAIAKMLDWDAPLSEQPEAIQKAIADGMREHSWPEAKIKEVLAERNAQQLLNYLSPSGNKAQASETLLKYGIPGIKYLDQGSRSGTHWMSIAKDGKIHVLGPENNSVGTFPTREEALAFSKRKNAESATRNFVVFDDSIPKIISKE
jgi:hypothetical protein